MKKECELEKAIVLLIDYKKMNYQTICKHLDNIKEYYKEKHEESIDDNKKITDALLGISTYQNENID